MSERRNSYGGRLYRARDGMAMGVCKGLARHFGVSVFWVRLAFVGLVFITALWPMVVAYIVMGLVLKPEPVMPLRSADDDEFYRCYTESRTVALNRLQRRLHDLRQRIERIETTVTSPGYDWQRRMDRN